MLLLTDKELKLDEMVRKNYRAAEVLKKYGIGYCCGGRMTLEEACTRKGLDPHTVAEELEMATSDSFLLAVKAETWKTDFLVDYLIHVHHAYLQTKLPLLEADLISFARGHSKRYPELTELQAVFSKITPLLLDHIGDAARVLFPYIKQVDGVFRNKEAYGKLFVRTLRKPLDKALERHAILQELLLRLRDLTQGYAFPENACVNHEVIYQRLQEFDQQFTQYRYLEHDLLFRKVTTIEQELLLA